MGNKNDIDDLSIDFEDKNINKGEVVQRQVSTFEGIEFAKKNQVSFFEVSAFEHESVAKAFDVLAE